MLKPIEHWKNTLGKLGMRVQRRRMNRKNIDLGCSFETLEYRIAMSIDSPVIAGLLASPTNVPSGNQITLTASGVTDPNNDAITQVQFFRDVDFDGVLTGSDGAALGTDTDGSNGWGISVSSAGFSAGTNRYFAVATDATSLNSDPVSATNTILSPTRILDDAESGFSVLSGTWQGPSNSGYNNDHYFSWFNNGAVEWRFANVVAGTYRVSATWTNSASNSAVAPYDILDGTNALATTLVNQKNAPAADVTAGGRNFQHLGEFEIVNGELVVRLTNTTATAMSADAIRLEHIGPAVSASEIRVYSGSSELFDAASTINLGSTFIGTEVPKTLTVKNVGVGTLNLTQLTQGVMPSGIKLVSGYGSTTLAQGETTTFTVALAATAIGNVSGTLSIVNNDPNEASFDIALTGVVNAVTVKDDGDSGYSVISGTWQGPSNSGYNNDHYFSWFNNGAVEWQFNNLLAGEYRISATWTNAANRAASAPYLITGGDIGPVTALVNQKNAPAADATEGGRNFQDLGKVHVVNGQLVVRLTNTSATTMSADAIRLEYLLPAEIRVLDGATELSDGTSTVNYGSVFYGTPKTFTVQNSGTGTLNLTQLTQGVMPAGFQLVSGLASTSLAPGASTTFTVAIASATPGTVSGTLSILSNDLDERSFDINLTGVVSTVAFKDDGDSGYSVVSGTWNNGNGGYSSDHKFSWFNNGVVEWRFGNLLPATYRISATWPNSSSNSATAPFDILDSTNDLARVLVNQKNAPAADVVAGGRNFQDLGTFEVVNGELVVRLTNTTASAATADAIRLEYVGPATSVSEIRVYDGAAELYDAASTINLGSTFLGTEVAKTFTVKNVGVGTLNLTQLTQGVMPAGYRLVSGYGSTTLAHGQTTTFTVALAATSLGTAAGTLSIVNNDPNEASFDVALTGVVNAVTVKDDGDSGYSVVSGTWQGPSNSGYNNDHYFSYFTNGVVEWRFTNVVAGTYRVSATWTNAANRSAAAPYEVLDGTNSLASVPVNQKNAPAANATAGGRNFQHLGQFEVVNGELIVRLSNTSATTASADAIRLEYLGPTENASEIRVSNGSTELADGVSTVDFGATFNGTQRTLTVKNVGVGNLTLTQLTQAAMPTGFELVSGFGTTTLAQGQTTTFTIALAAPSLGAVSGTLSIATNDPDEASFDIQLTGIAQNTRVIDDEDVGFSVISGTWGESTGGYNNDQYTVTSGDTGVVEWRQELTPGQYRVSAAWTAGATRSSVAAYTVLDGSTTLATREINQKFAATADATIGGRPFQSLGVFSVTNGSLAIQLADTSVLSVSADAVYLEYVAPLPEVQFGGAGGSLVVDGAPATVLDFEDSERTNKATLSVAVTNTTGAAITLTQLTQGDMPAGYVLVDALGTLSLAAGATTYFRVRLDAITPGTYAGTIAIDSSAAAFNLDITGQVISTAVIVDNGHAEFQTTGTGWVATTDGSGFRDGLLKTSGVEVNKTASWTVEGLVPGQAYLVYATYAPSATNTAAAPYKLYDGATLEKQFTVSQRATFNPVTALGASFGYVGQIKIDSGTLNVELDAANVSDGDVVADAIYVVPVTAGDFQSLTAPTEMVTGSEEYIEAVFADPDGQLADSINVYRDTNNNGVLDLGIDHVLAIDTTLVDGLSFDMSTLASGFYKIFVAAMNNGVVVDSRECACTVSTWWTVSIEGVYDGEARFDHFGTLSVANSRVQVSPTDVAGKPARDHWKVAVEKAISGTITSTDPNNNDEVVTERSFPGGFFAIATQKELSETYEGHDRFPINDAQKVIALEDWDDNDFDDMGWGVKATPDEVITTTGGGDDPNPCSCECTCSQVSITGGGDVKTGHSLGGGVDLVANTGTMANPIIRAKTNLPVLMSSPPDSVEVKLTFNGVEQTTVYYTGAGFAAGDEVVFAVQPDTTGMASGRYDWEMTVLYKYGTETVPAVFVGSQDVVSRAGSELGNGFSIAELDRLDIQSTGANLITGDNHAIWYAKTGSNTFIGEAGDLTYSTLVKNGDGSYTLTSADGMQSHFDATGLLASRVDTTGNTRTYAYNLDSTIASITDHVGRAVTFTHTDGRISSVEDFDGSITTLAYDSAGNLLSVTQPDPDGSGPLAAPVTTYGYDSLTGLLITIVDPRGEVTAMEYDHAGKLSKVVQPCGGTSTYSMFRSLAVADLAVNGATPLNPAPLVSADAVEVIRDEVGNETRVRRDRFGNVIWQEDALGNVTTFERNADGLVTTMTQPDPDGVGPLGALVTEMEYDSRGNLTRLVHPDLTEETWTYDATFSRPTSHTDQLGRQTLWSVDPTTGLVLSTTRVVGAIDSLLNGETDDVSTSQTYTTGLGGVPSGLVETMTDALGRITSYAYTTNGLLQTLVQAVGTPDEATTSFEYDASDNLTAMVDAIGRRTEYAYDNLARMISMTQAVTAGPGPQAHFWQFVYDAAGNRTHMTDPLGNVTEYVYDERGRLVEIIQPDPDGAGPQTSPSMTYDFNCVNNLVGIVDALGRETAYEYDELNRLVRSILPDPDGAGPLAAPVLDQAYNSVGWVASTTDALGNATTYTYDAMGRVVSITQPDPDGAGPLAAPVTSYTFDVAGQRLASTDPLGRVTTYEYDDLGRLTKTTSPDPDGAGPGLASWTVYAYDKAGNLLSTTDRLGNATSYAYDNLDRMVSITQADPDEAGPLTAPMTSFTYDAVGQRLTSTDPLGRVTTFEYDGLGRLTKTTEPDPDGAGSELAAWTVFTYDAVGNLLSQSDRLNNTMSYTYDNLYRLVETIDANGSITAYTYDAVGNWLSLTDPSGNTTHWIYDDLNRVIEEENELEDSRYFAYDTAGNLIERTDRNGRVTQYAYDNLQRRTSEKWMDGVTVVKEFAWSYDAASQVVGLGDGTADYTYQYDGEGRMTQSQFDFAALPQPVTLDQTFDAASRRTSLFATLGATADFKNEFGYDALDRLTTITQQGQSGGNAVAEKRIDFKYLADGRTSEINRFADVAGTQNVVNTALGYDGAGRLTGMTHSKGATTFADYGWAYDAANRMTAFTNTVYPSEDAAYTHDATGQLTGADRTGSGDDESYVYDDNGNRVTASGDTYTTSANNQIASDGTNSYTYDAEGNITRITNIATGDYRDLTWDYRNRLTQVTQFDSSDIEQWRVEYVYDAMNRLVGRTEFVGGSSTASSDDNFIYDGYQMVLKLDASGNVESRTLWGAGVDQILATEDAAGNVTWPLTDHLNTVRDIVSYDSGTDTTTPENHIAYDSFGNVVSETNPSVASDFLFTARYTDATTGLQWNLNRWYSPSIGRWMSEDPIGFAAGDPNVMRYVHNRATNVVDPSGLDTIDPVFVPSEPFIPGPVPYPFSPFNPPTAGNLPPRYYPPGAGPIDGPNVSPPTGLGPIEIPPEVLLPPFGEHSLPCEITFGKTPGKTHVEIIKQPYRSRLNLPEGKDAPDRNANPDAFNAWAKSQIRRLAGNQARAFVNDHLGIDQAQNVGRDVPCPAPGARGVPIGWETSDEQLTREADGSYTARFTLEIFYR
jgi:RHS repeat-associated protein